MNLTICICSIKSRSQKLQSLLRSIDKQAGECDIVHVGTYWGQMITRTYKDIEVIIALDDHKIRVGKKRNLLKQQALGKFISFVDDDDRIAPDYVASILEKTAGNWDVICFEVFRTENGKDDRIVRYSARYHSDYTKPDAHYRIPNHLMAWNARHAKRVRFPEKNFGEDSYWARLMKVCIKQECQIGKTLYYYDFDNNKTTTNIFT